MIERSLGAPIGASELVAGTNMANRLQQDFGRSAVTESLAAAGYDVEHAVGAGTGGQVYKAIQRSTGQAVAIKVMALPELDSAMHVRRVERFRREIAFCSSLYHPDIVRLLDSGALSEGNRFAVFEFIPGRTLAELLRDEGMLKVQRARHLMAQALPPLAYAHAKGIAHRDFKPGNVMVTSDSGRDRLKVLDFGISISVSPQDEAELARLTQSHEWLGTPLYAAPEQLRGEATGPKSDLYAWALTFVECLTGRPLISGKSLMDIIAHHSRPDRHALHPALAHHRLGALLLRVLEKDPARRLGDAQLVHSLLERISLEGLEDGQGYLREASPVSAQYRARPIGATDTVTDADPLPQTEQRHVTALCCRVSLVGTGGLSSVEQVDALLDDSYNLVSEVLRQFGATAAQSVGGYSLWYFGVAHAHDADARLAIRSALEIITRMEALPTWFSEAGIALVTQIGVHSGPITVQLSDGGRKPVDGVTARVAMELASFSDLAGQTKPGHRVLVSDDFRQLVARYADLEPHGEAELVLPWRTTPVRPFRLKGESIAAGLRAERSPFVGRVDELSQLVEAWRKTGAGEGAAVLIEGEAGIGKSRLAAELMTRLDSEGCRTLETRCLPEWHSASLRPLQVLVTDLLALGNAPPTEHPERLERKVSELGLDVRVAVPLFCVWLSVSLPAGYSLLAWSPQKQRSLLHTVIIDFLLLTMERGAALLVEDIHWADPSTLECLDGLLTKSRDRAALTVMTSRPDRAFSWTISPQRLLLGGLDDAAAATLAAALLDDAAHQHDVTPLVARADGIPLYLEELAMSLRAASALLATPPQTARESGISPVPLSLRHLLSARLEVLGRGRETAQFAAAVGREFSLELLTQLQSKDDLSLLSDLEELVAAQVLLKRLRVEGPVYLFRHALIRDAAYDSTSAEVRRRYHEQIADALREKLPRIAEMQPDVVASHYDRANNRVKAIEYWHLAAQRTSAASAHAEAMSHIDRALTLHREAGASAPDDLQEAALLLTRGAIIVAKRGYTDSDAKASFERIISLVPARGQALNLAFAARWGLWYYNNARCNLEASFEIADELRHLAQDGADSTLSITAWAAVCQSRFCGGKLEESVRASRAAAAEYDLETHRQLTLRYGDDPRVSAGSFEALAEMIRGKHALAVERVSEVMQLIDELGYPSLKAGMHGQSAWLFLQWGGSGASQPDFRRASQHAADALKLASEHGFPFWELYGKLNELAIRVASGDSHVARELKMYSDIWCSSGANLGRDWHLTFAAQGLHRAGELEEAARLFDEAIAFCDTHRVRYFEPEARRQRAMLLADEKNPARDLDRAVAECWRATDDARTLGADWWQLASLMSIVHISPGTAREAVHQLAQLLASFPPGEDEPPLVREARRVVA